MRFKKYQEEKHKVPNGESRPGHPVSFNNIKAEQPGLDRLQNDYNSSNVKDQPKKKEDDESTGEPEFPSFQEQPNDELILNSRFGKITP